jgi:hypothetical protein
MPPISAKKMYNVSLLFPIQMCVKAKTTIIYYFAEIFNLMTTVYRSSDIKKELQQLNQAELISLNLRLVRFKKENKELLTYLLFKADNQELFISDYKEEMDHQFAKVDGKSFLVVKTLRKIATQMNNQIRYAGSELVAAELLLHYCNNYIHYINYKTPYKPLHNIFFRFVEKLKGVILKLEDDLRYDFGLLYEAMLLEAEEKILWFKKDRLML